MVRGPRFELGTPRFSVCTSYSEHKSLEKNQVAVLLEDLDLEILEFDHHSGIVELELDHAGMETALLLEVLGELR